MEFPDLGQHCAMVSCRQLDFLPFSCEACKNVYCKDHIGKENHSCSFLHAVDRRVPVCPLCNQPVSLGADESPDHKVNEHIENDCKSDLAKRKRASKCGLRGCKQRELIPVLCSSCKQNFCLRHRHEVDHDCPARPAEPGSRNSLTTSASVRAGQAAALREKSSSAKRPAAPAALSNRPQQTGLSILGSELNRARTERLQSGLASNPRSTSAQEDRPSPPTQLSEDEALALAIQASLADAPSESNSQESHKTPVLPSPHLTEDDLALAQAIAESEKDEMERQRRMQHSEQESKSKDRCHLS